MGIDGCHCGWVGVIAGLSSPAPCPTLHYVGGAVLGTLSGLLSWGASQGVVLSGCDIPIGLEVGPRDMEDRLADRAARKILRDACHSSRGSSVFPPPSESGLARIKAGLPVRMPAQCLGISRKVAEANQMLISGRPDIIEVHPEVSFVALDAYLHSPPKPLLRKKRRVGRTQRLALLEAVYGQGKPDVVLTELRSGRSRDLAKDDVLDALVSAWTAARIKTDQAQWLPAGGSSPAWQTRKLIWC